ncbi:MAG: hypothetical protein COA38_02960 [Fluviicola sp.]|nr:MAG: hypothetical protein COA38_02960 [Fluviicola sp.]
MGSIKHILLFVSLILSSVCFGNMDDIQQEIDRHVSSGHYDSAQYYIKSELSKKHAPKTIIELKHQLSRVLIYSSNYKEALEVAYDAIDLIKDNKEKGKFYFLIGCIFYSVEDYEKSIEYFDLLLTENEPSLNAKALLILSEIYSSQSDDDKSLKALKRANKIAQNSKIDSKLTDQIALQYNLRIENYEVCKRISEVMILDSTSFLITRCNALSTIGDCLMKQDSLEKAIEYYERALDLTIETNDPDLIKTTSWLLIEAYEKIGNQDKANAYHKIYNDAINDSAYFSIDKYRGLYALEKERASKKDTKKSNQRSWVIGISLVMVPIAIILAVLVRKKRKAIAEQEEIAKKSSKKIQINSDEIEKIERSINAFITSQLYLESNITRKSFCEKNDIKSERYLSQFINDKYEKSFSLFLNDLRVEYAHDRLKTDTVFRKYKTSEIAKACGFGSLKTFERAFSSKFGKTPFDFIESIND